MVQSREVECLYLRLQEQELRLGVAAKRLASIHRLLTAWREEDMDDYLVLISICQIIGGYDFKPKSLITGH